VLEQLTKSKTFNEPLDMMYMVASGKVKVTKRRIQVLQVGEDSFRVYCFLRKSKRTFRIDNVLALVPVILKKSMVI